VLSGFLLAVMVTVAVGGHHILACPPTFFQVVDDAGESEGEREGGMCVRRAEK
jgi:hypothetical protein